MRKLFSLIAAVLFAGSMMAEEATMTAGTNGSACTVNDVAGIKCGTSSKGGDMTITVGAGATKLSFYAAAWKGVTGLSLNFAADGVTFSPASVSLTADDGISNNSPFTLVGSAEDFKFEVELTGVTAETTIAVTSSAAKRFVVWGASYEAGEVPPTPADTYTVAGAPEEIFGAYWNPEFADNDMKKVGGIYKWEKAELNLAVGIIEFKVVKNHSWDIAYPAQNYVVNIAEAGEYTLTITFDPSTEAVAAEAVKKEPLADPTNCAEAAEAALSVSANNELYNDGKEYTIEGYVTSIAYAWKEGSMSFWMADAADGGNVLEAYKCAIENEEDAVRLGDKVAVTGKLTKYNTTPEFAAGCTVVIIERAEVVEPKNLGEKTIAEFLELKNQRDTCILTGTVANVKNTEYGNFDLVELGNAEVSVYVYGLLTAAGEAKKCFAEENIAEGDTLKVLAIYTEYNAAPQVKNAIFVEVKHLPVQQDTIAIQMVSTSATLKWNDQTASQGWWQIQAQNDNYYITLSNLGGREVAAGTYEWAEMDPSYSYLYDLTADAQINFVDGTIVVEETEEAIFVTAELLDEDNNVYVITLIYAVEEPNPYKYDDDSDFIVTFEEYTIDETNLAAYGSVNIEGEDEEGHYINLDVTLPEGAEALVAGVYTIDDTYGVQTVHAGMYDDTYGIIPSIAATLVEYEGELYYDKLWYLVSGTVTIDENLNVTVEAKNSLGHDIKVLLKGAQEQGVNNVEAAQKAIKSIMNGQLVIEKNGKTFNAAGQMLK